MIKNILSAYRWTYLYVALNEFTIPNVATATIDSRIFQLLGTKCVIVASKLSGQLIIGAASLTRFFRIQIDFIVYEALQESRDRFEVGGFYGREIRASAK